jgi:hypothetical protein
MVGYFMAKTAKHTLAVNKISSRAENRDHGGHGDHPGPFSLRKDSIAYLKKNPSPTVLELLIRPYKTQESSGHLRVCDCVAEFPSDALL